MESKNKTIHRVNKNLFDSDFKFKSGGKVSSMDSNVVDTYENKETVTLLRGTEISDSEKKIIFRVLKHLAEINKKEKMSEVILASKDYDDLVKHINGCDSTECLLCNAVKTYHVCPKSLLMLTMAIHSRVPSLDNSNSWYDNFTLNSFLFQLTTVVWKKYDNNTDDVIYSVKGEPEINKSVELTHPQELLFHLGNTYRVFKEFDIELSKRSGFSGLFGFSNGAKDINQLTNEEATSYLDKLVEKYVYFTGGTHGCDVFDMPEKSVSIDDIKEFCARYPNTTVGYILNTKTYASGSGQHWVMLTFKGKYSYLICSFGHDYAIFDDGQKLMKSLSTPSAKGYSFGELYNTFRMQKDNSSCGMYSTLSTLAFLIEAYKSDSKTDCVKIQNVVDLIGEDAGNINSDGIYAIKGKLNGYKNEK